MKSGGLLVNYLGQAWAAVISFAFIPLYLKYLGPDAYALVGFYAVFQAWMSILDSGLTQYLQREVGRMGNELWGLNSISYRYSFSRLVLVAEFAAFVLACISILIGYLFANYFALSWFQVDVIEGPVIHRSILLMSFVVAVRLFESFYRSLLVGAERHLFLNSHLIIFSTLRAVGAIVVLTAFSTSIESYFLWQLVVTCAAAVVFKIYISCIFSYPSSSVKTAALFRFGAISFARGAYGLALVSTIIFQADRLVLSRFLPMSEFGYFSAAAGVSGMVLLLLTPLSSYFYPKLCSAIETDNHALFRYRIHIGTQVLVSTIAPFAITGAIAAKPVLIAWSQDSLMAEAVSPLLSLLLLANFVNALSYLPYLSQLSLGNTSTWFRIYVVCSLLYFPALIVVAERYGAFGSSVCWLLFNICVLLSVAKFGFSGLTGGLRKEWLIRSVFPPLMASFISSLILGIVLNSLQLVPRLQFILCLVIGVILVSIISVGFAPDLRRISLVEIKKYYQKFRIS